MTTKHPLNQQQIETKYKLHPKHVREILENVPPVMQMKYGRGFMRYYDDDVIKPIIKKWKEDREPKVEAAPVAPPAPPMVHDDKLHDKVDNLALGVDLLIEKVEQLSSQNAILLKAIEKLQAPKIEAGALDKFLTTLPSSEGNGAKTEAAKTEDFWPIPAKKVKPKVMIVGLPAAHVSGISKEFADLDLSFHSAERAKKLASATARGYDRVIVLLDYLNWGLPVLGTDVKRVDVKGGVSSLKTALTKVFVELTDA